MTALSTVGALLGLLIGHPTASQPSMNPPPMSADAISAPDAWAVSPLADKNAKIRAIRSTDEEPDPFAKVIADWDRRPNWRMEHYRMVHSGRVFDVTAAIEFVEDSPHDEDLYAHFLRVGDITLVNRNRLPKGWSNVFDSRSLIYLDGPMEFMDYLVPILVAMQVHGDLFKNAVVEDMGSGNGEITLVALALGASMAIGIDIKPETTAKAKKNWEANPHLHAGGKAQFLTESIENWLGRTSTGLKVPDGAKRILVTDLGPVYKAYSTLTHHVAGRRDYSLAVVGGLEGDSRRLTELPGSQHFRLLHHFWRVSTFFFKSIYAIPPFSNAAFAATPHESLGSAT